MNNFKNQHWNKNNNAQNQQTGNQEPPTENQPAQNKGLFSLPPAVMSMVPWIPFLLEATTGQKIPQMGGTIGEIQQGIQQIRLAQVQIIQNQQDLTQRLSNLESNTSNQFTNLNQQVQSIKSIRLTHDRERKQIDYNLQHENETN